MSWSMKVAFWIGVLGGLLGCPPAPMPTVRDAAPAPHIVTCAPEWKGLSIAAPGMFTASGMPCARCSGVSSCYDQQDGMWCCAGDCNADPHCTLQFPDTPAP